MISQKGGANHKGSANLLFGQFLQKLHENEEILGQKKALPLCPSRTTPDNSEYWDQILKRDIASAPYP